MNRLRPHHSALDLHAIVSSDGVFTSGDLHADLERVAPTARPVTEERLRARIRPPGSLRSTARFASRQAMAARVTIRLWDVADLVDLLVAAESEKAAYVEA